MTHSNLLILIFILLFILSCKNDAVEAASSRKIQISDLIILKNSCSTDTAFHRIRTTGSTLDSKYLPLLLSATLKNSSGDTIVIETSPRENVVFDVNEQIQVKYPEFRHEQFHTEPVMTRWDTLSPLASKTCLIPHPGPLSLEHGGQIYLKVGIRFCYLQPDTVRLRDSTYLVLPYKCVEKDQYAKSVVVRVNLLKNQAWLSDSTFEAVLENYKCRGYRRALYF